MIKINSYEDFINNTDKLTVEELQDIDKRIGDWLAAGGSLEDNYIKQQFRYAECIIKRR